MYSLLYSIYYVPVLGCGLMSMSGMNENDHQQMHCSPHPVMYLVQMKMHVIILAYKIQIHHHNHHIIHATIGDLSLTKLIKEAKCWGEDPEHSHMTRIGSLEFLASSLGCEINPFSIKLK